MAPFRKPDIVLSYCNEICCSHSDEQLIALPHPKKFLILVYEWMDVRDMASVQVVINTV